MVCGRDHLAAAPWLPYCGLPRASVIWVNWGFRRNRWKISGKGAAWPRLTVPPLRSSRRRVDFPNRGNTPREPSGGKRFDIRRFLCTLDHAKLVSPLTAIVEAKG
jgi:hypothetical protein